MVVLHLQSSKGNAGGRYFPHSGYLGLSPVTLDGIVRTRTDLDSKPILASEITVSLRCYEARLGRIGVIRTNVLFDHTQVLWQKAPDSEWTEVTNVDLPFTISLPPETPAGYSTSNLQSYRVYWKLEAIVHHIPIAGVGSRLCKSYDVALVRYDRHRTISPVRPPIPLPNHLLISAHVITPLSSIGPVESFPVQIALQPRPGVIPQRITISIKRRVHLYNEAGPSRSSSSPAYSRRPAEPQHLGSSGDDATVMGSDDDDETVIPDDEPSAAKYIPSTLATETSSFDRRWSESAQSDIYSRQISMQMPHAKTSHYWAIGESMRTSMVHIKFVISTKIVFTTASGANETIKLEDHEFPVCTINESERQHVLTQPYTTLPSRQSTPKILLDNLPEPPRKLYPGDDFELHSTMPSKSTKRPHPSHGHHTDVISSSSKPPTSGSSPLAFFDRRKRGTTPPNSFNSLSSSPISVSTSSVLSTPSVPLLPPIPPTTSKSKAPKSSKSSRRPHTASGQSRPFSSDNAPSDSTNSPSRLLTVSRDDDHPSTRRRLSSNSDEQLVSTGAAITARSVKLGFEPDQVRAWEEELDRIASFSKRRSVAAGVVPAARVGVGVAGYAVGT